MRQVCIRFALYALRFSLYALRLTLENLPNLVCFPRTVLIENNRKVLLKTEIANYLYLLLLSFDHPAPAFF